MKKIYLLLLCYILVWFQPVIGQYSYEFLKVPDSIVSRLQGDHVYIYNPQIHCADSTAAIVRGNGDLGIDTGLFLSTHYVQHAFEPLKQDKMVEAYWNARFRPMYYFWNKDSFSSRPGIRTIDEMLATHAMGISQGYFFDKEYFVSEFDRDYSSTFMRLFPPRPQTKYGRTDYLTQQFIRGTCAVSFNKVPYIDTIAVDFVYYHSLLDLPLKQINSMLYRGHAEADPFDSCALYQWLHRNSIMGIVLASQYDTINIGVYDRLSEKNERIPVNAYTLRVDLDTVLQAYDEGMEGEGKKGEPYPYLKQEYLYWDIKKPYRDYLVDYRGTKVADYFNYTMGTKRIGTGARVNPCDTYQVTMLISNVWTYYNCSDGSYLDGKPYGFRGAKQNNAYQDLFGSSILVNKIRGVKTEQNNFRDCSLPDDDGTSLKQYSLSNHCSVGPNPYRDELEIKFDRTLAQETGFELRIMNVVGQEVLQAQGDLYDLNEHLQRWAPNSAIGMYVLQLMHPRLGQQHWKLTKLEK